MTNTEPEPEGYPTELDPQEVQLPHKEPEHGDELPKNDPAAPPGEEPE